MEVIKVIGAMAGATCVVGVGVVQFRRFQRTGAMTSFHAVMHGAFVGAAARFVGLFILQL